MCGRYELTTEFVHLPSILKKDFPNGLEDKYVQQKLIRPADPVLVLKNEGKIYTSLMLWGFISEWAKAPFENSLPRPFNARAETIGEKKLFRGSWKHKRCVLPASGFFEKGYRIRRKDSQPFWLAGIWNRWMSSDGSELETCCVITTEPNELVRPFHNRMPVIIPNGLEVDWMEQQKDAFALMELKTMLTGWNPAEWIAEPIDQFNFSQMSLF